MKKYFFFLICIILYTNISAQMITKDTIVGFYHQPSGSPEGGTELIVYPNNRFVAVFFGGMINGKWKLKGNTVSFIPDYEPDYFILYGRKTMKLKEGIRVIFENFEEGNSKFVNFGFSPENPVLNMQQVFNDDSNCFNYPYIYKDTRAIQIFRFATKQNYWDEASDYNVYTFDNSAKYNDFAVIYNPKSEEKKPFNATYIKGGLLFNSTDKVSAKKDLSKLDEEENSYFEKLATLKIIDEVRYYNKDYFSVDTSADLKIDYYQYDKINDLYFSPNLEKAKDSMDFDYSEPRNSELLPYKRITELNILKQVIKINSTPLFIAKCD